MRKNEEIIDIIKSLCDEKEISISELARRVDMAKSAISRYFNKTRQFPLNRTSDFAKALNITDEYLLGLPPYDDTTLSRTGWDDVPQVDPANPSKGAAIIPVLGRVAAGTPFFASEDILDYEEIPEEWTKSGTYFALQIKGDSMSPRIMEKDVVIVRQQADAESGDIVIAKVNGDDACCKKLIKHKNGISLVSLNSAYEPMVFMDEDVSYIPVSIIGKVVELRGKF